MSTSLQDFVARLFNIESDLGSSHYYQIGKLVRISYDGEELLAKSIDIEHSSNIEANPIMAGAFEINTPGSNANIDVEAISSGYPSKTITISGPILLGNNTWASLIKDAKEATLKRAAAPFTVSLDNPTDPILKAFSVKTAPEEITWSATFIADGTGYSNLPSAVTYSTDQSEDKYEKAKWYDTCIRMRRSILPGFTRGEYEQIQAYLTSIDISWDFDIAKLAVLEASTNTTPLIYHPRKLTTAYSYTALTPIVWTNKGYDGVLALIDDFSDSDMAKVPEGMHAINMQTAIENEYQIYLNGISLESYLGTSTSQLIVKAVNQTGAISLTPNEPIKISMKGIKVFS